MIGSKTRQAQTQSVFKADFWQIERMHQSVPGIAFEISAFVSQMEHAAKSRTVNEYSVSAKDNLGLMTSIQHGIHIFPYIY